MSNDVDDEFDRMQETIDSLRAENARLNKENDDWHEASRRLREEASTARLALDVATKEVEALRAKLKWFEERETVVQQLLAQIAFESPEYCTRSTEHLAEVVRDFKLENPPPGAAT